jgi:hypothetical protein
MNYNESLMEKLKVQHLALPHLITGVTANHLLWPPLAGKWSIHDNIAHLARYQQLFITRIDQILFSNIPVFEPYKADVDPGFAVFYLNLNPRRIKRPELVAHRRQKRIGRGYQRNAKPPPTSCAVAVTLPKSLLKSPWFVMINTTVRSWPGSIFNSYSWSLVSLYDIHLKPVDARVLIKILSFFQLRSIR